MTSFNFDPLDTTPNPAVRDSDDGSRHSINDDVEGDAENLFPSPIVEQNDQKALFHARLKKGGGLLATTVVAGIIWGIPIIDSNPTAHRCLALLIWVSVLWTTELLPIWVTSLCIPVLVVVMQIIPPAPGVAYSAKTAAATVMGEMVGEAVLLAFAAFTMSLAFTKYQLSQRLVSSGSSTCCFETLISILHLRQWL